MEYERVVYLEGGPGPNSDTLPAAPGMELYICPTCGRGELYLPQKALERRKDEEDRACSGTFRRR